MIFNELKGKTYHNDNKDFQEFYRKSRFNFHPGIANGDEIEEFLKAGFLKNVEVRKINATSIDLNLNDDFKVFKEPGLIDLTTERKEDTTVF